MHSTINFIIPKSSEGVLVNRSLEILLSRVEVQELLLFIKKNNDPILREIIAAFPQWNRREISEILEELIKNHLIIRENRRYFYNIPTLRKISNDDLLSLVQQYNQWITEYITNHPINDDILATNEYIVHLKGYLALNWIHLSNHPIYENIDHIILKQPNIIKANKSLFMDITSTLPSNITFSDYFINIERQKKLSLAQQEIFDIIGDVNREFFLYQCAKKLQRIRRRGYIDESYNIFNDTLEKMGWIKNEKNHLLLSSTVYSKKQSQYFFEANISFKESALYNQINQYIINSEDAYLTSCSLFTNVIDQEDMKCYQWLFTE